ncbi:hypothetical protein CN918_25650 [Priestia megaterium]|nr:hypothetical protein CN918_25650 [Priestia megaterium]
MGTFIALTVLAAIKFGWVPVLTAHLSTLPIVAGALWFQRKREKKRCEKELLFHWSSFHTFYTMIIKKQAIWSQRKQAEGHCYQTKYKDWHITIKKSMRGYVISMFYQDVLIMKAIYDETDQTIHNVQRDVQFIENLKKQNEGIRGMLMLNKIVSVLIKKEWLTTAVDIENEEKMIDIIIECAQTLDKDNRQKVHVFLTNYIEGIKDRKRYKSNDKAKMQKILQVLTVSLLNYQKGIRQFSLSTALEELVNELNSIQGEKIKGRNHFRIPLEAWDKLEFDFHQWNKKEQNTYLAYKEHYLDLAKHKELSESEKLYMEHGWLKVSRYATTPEYRLMAFRQQKRLLKQLHKQKQKIQLHID